MTEVTQVSGMSGYQGQEAVLSTDEAGQMTMAGVQNAKHADSDGASRKARSPYPIADDEDINIDDYEMVDPEFFAQIKEAACMLSGSLDEVPGGELIGVAEAALLWPSAG